MFRNAGAIATNFHLDEKMTPSVKIFKWLFMKAQNGNGRQDMHFIYVNMVLKSYIENDVDSDAENDTVKVFFHRKRIAGTTAILLNGSPLLWSVLETPFNFTKTGILAAHEVQWHADKV